MAFTILINENSGSVEKHGKDTLSEKLRIALGDQFGDIHFHAPDEISGILRTIDNGQLIIGGGDGTIRTAASILKDREIPFGILPLGTMNLFAKDLSLEQDIFKLAEQYKSFKEIQIDAATVNKEIFLCNAMVGLPSELAKEREKNRGQETISKWFGFMKKSLHKLSFGKKIPLSLRHHGTTEHMMIKAAIIANNEYEDKAGLGSWQKKSLTDGKLAIYTISPEGTMESLALLSSLALGSWKQKDTAGFDFFNTKNLSIDTHHSKLKVLLDGEIHRLRTPLTFEIHPLTLRILVPAA